MVKYIKSYPDVSAWVVNIGIKLEIEQYLLYIRSANCIIFT